MQKWKWAFKKNEKKKNIQGMRVHLHHRRHGQWQHFKSDRHPPQHWWWVGRAAAVRSSQTWRSKRGRGRWSMMSRWPYHRLNVIPVWLLHRCSSRGQRPCGVELKGKSASFFVHACVYLCYKLGPRRVLPGMGRFYSRSSRWDVGTSWLLLTAFQCSPQHVDNPHERPGRFWGQI